MKLTVYEQESLFEELKPEWNELLQRSEANRIFSTWEWLSTWWKAYHPGKLWVIVCRTDDGRLVGIAPWFIEENAKWGRIVRSIGCVDVTDYLDVIADAGCIVPVLDFVSQFAAQHTDKYDAIDLCNIPQFSPTFAHFPKILERNGFKVQIQQQEVCPTIELPEDWESYLGMLDKKQRHEVRRKIRRTEGAPENIDWYIVGAEHDLNAEIERFLSLMRASDPEKATFLEDEKNLAFFKAIVPIIYEKGWLQLSFLTVNDEAQAAYLNFDYNNQILVYNSGLQSEFYGHLSLGIVLLAHNIRYAIENGRSVFDFLRGNETYKYRMGGQDVPIYMLRAEPA